MWPTVRNLGVFQGLWFLVVIGGDAFAVFAFGWAMYHVVSYADQREHWQLPIYIGLGLLMDWTLTSFGVFEFSTTTLALPLWLIALWFIFPTTLLHGLRWCWSGKYWVLLLSSLGAALTYIGGARLGDLLFPLGEMVSLIVLTIAWAVYFTLIRCVAYWKS